ncbi:MAG: VOC family protein [Pseudomonadota bacterium]
MSKASPLRWSHALIKVANMEAMVDFYTDLLGFEITNREAMNEQEFVFMSQVDTDHHQIAFISGRPDQPPPPAANHFSFRVGNLAEVKAWFEKLNSDARVERVSPVTHGNAWSIYFMDPEQNGIEIFCDSPWHVAQPAGGKWDPNADDETIMAETKAKFQDKPEFQPIEEYYARRREALKA